MIQPREVAIQKYNTHYMLMIYLIQTYIQTKNKIDEKEIRSRQYCRKRGTCYLFLHLTGKRLSAEW